MFHLLYMYRSGVSLWLAGMTKEYTVADTGTHGRDTTLPDCLIGASLSQTFCGGRPVHPRAGSEGLSNFSWVGDRVQGGLRLAKGGEVFLTSNRKVCLESAMSSVHGSIPRNLQMCVP